MRTELYADSRDVWKWSVAIRCARQSGQSILWVAMLRPMVGVHGGDRKVVEGALPEVSTFFDEERRRHDNGQPKSLARVTKLCAQIGIELFSDLEAYPATLARRDRYINRIVEITARPRDLKYFVLLDPDNGLGEAESKGEQIHVSHLRRIWENMRDGDTLALVQFQHFVANWIGSLRKKIAGVLTVDVPRVCPFPWDNVCLFVVERAVTVKFSNP